MICLWVKTMSKWYEMFNEHSYDYDKCNAISEHSAHSNDPDVLPLEITISV